MSVTRPRLVACLLVAFIALLAASMALLPGVAFWDTGELQAVGPLMGTAHPTGFPTYVLLAWLASVVLQPFGEPAFRMNLLSALCLAVAAGVTVDLVRALTGHLVLGIAAGIAMALTPIAWAIGTHAETHSLHLALVAILLWLLVAWERRSRSEGRATGVDTADRGDRFLIAAAIVFGLAVGNHSLTLLLAVPVGLFVLAVYPGIWRRGRLIASCLAALAITVVLVYLELPLRAGPFRAALVYGTPNTWEGFKYIVLAEQFQGSLSHPFDELPRKFGELVGRTAAQFGILAPLIPVAFLVTALRRPRYGLLTGSAVAITCFFSASYVNADINRYYLGPALMAWTWVAILAAAVVEPLRRVASDAPAAGTTLARAAPADTRDDPFGRRTRAGLIATLIAVALVAPTLIAIPTRYPTIDSRRRLEAVTWTAHVVATLAPDAVIVSWWSYSTPLWYAQRVEGERPDVTIIDDRTRLDENLGGLTDVIDANLGKRPVYVIRDDRNEVALLASRYDLQYIDGSDASALTRVIGLKGS
ncbi:MAG: hypothetical protein QOE66_2951 [Chloroflexota bacterium]|jgi:hypothetical protein|nr:hypothetical protein [Chloroflexota bacterium]